MVGEEVGNGVVAVFVGILECFVVASSGIESTRGSERRMRMETTSLWQLRHASHKASLS